METNKSINASNRLERAISAMQSTADGSLMGHYYEICKAGRSFQANNTGRWCVNPTHSTEMGIRVSGDISVNSDLRQVFTKMIK